MKNDNKGGNLSFIVALAVGLLLGWLDTRPHWNDSGVSASALIITALFCGYLTRKRPWLVALAVGLWIPLFNVIIARNYSAIPVLAIAFIAVYAAFAVRRFLLVH